MSFRSQCGYFVLTLTALLIQCDRAKACCPSGRHGQLAINADQTVILIWDAATHTEHFIRKASFKAQGDDLGFLVPSPAEPELDESGNEAFRQLAQVTAPEILTQPGGGMACGCSAMAPNAAKRSVTVLREKDVAGFHATVLETDSAEALVDWLKEHGYAYSPAVRDWAAPYIAAKWKITAMKIAKAADNLESPAVNASALRMSFKSDRPLFPYREPAYGPEAKALATSPRWLRIYFIADGRYEGGFDTQTAWSGKVVWSGALGRGVRKSLLESLKITAATPADWWLTEIEDPWSYNLAPGDVYFARSVDQGSVIREPITLAKPNGDVTPYALGAMFLAWPLRRWRKRS